MVLHQNLFLVGVNIIVVTLIWAMEKKKTQDKVKKFFGNGETMVEDAIDELHLFKMGIKETLRLHPPALLLYLKEAYKKLSQWL